MSSTSRFRWLHLTDLHQGIGPDGWQWPVYKDHFFRDLAELHDQVGPWDLIFFTGDLTQRGSPEEYTRLDATLGEVVDHLNKLGSRPILLAVPGNHDLARPPPKSNSVILARNWHGDDNVEIADAFWSRADEEGNRKRVCDYFSGFQQWFSRWRASHATPPDLALEFRPGVLPGDFGATIVKNGFRLAVVGLNSAYLHLSDGNYEGKLDLDPRQLAGAIAPDWPAWLKSHHAGLLLTHHPPGWLHPKARERFQTEIAPPGYFVGHLFGHMHEGNIAIVQIPGLEPVRQIQGRSLFGLEFLKPRVERSHGYVCGALSTEGSDAGAPTLWPRRLLENQAQDQHFFSMGQDQGWPARLDGRGALSVPIRIRTLREAAPVASHRAGKRSPQPPGAAYDPDWYVERDTKNRMLESYLQTAGKPIVVLGSKFAGKTWQLNHVVDTAKRTLDGPRIVSIDLRLFREVSGTIDSHVGYIGRYIAQALDIPVNVMDAIEAYRLTAVMSLKFLMSGTVLPKNALTVLAFENADEILRYPFRDDFFGMLRHWAEQRDEPWNRLRLVIATSTPKLTENVNMSPFANLSEPFELGEFRPPQLQRLADWYALALSDSESANLVELTGGHPYLVRSAMYDAAITSRSIGSVLDTPETFDGTLDWYRRALEKQPRLREVIAGWKGGEVRALEPGDADKLARLGLVVANPGQAHAHEYRLRGRVYERLTA